MIHLNFPDIIENKVPEFENKKVYCYLIKISVARETYWYNRESENDGLQMLNSVVILGIRVIKTKETYV